MGNSKPNVPQPPPKTTKELVNDMKKGINKTIRELDRESNKLKFENTKIENELKKMVKNGESRNAMKILGNTYVKNNRYRIKYENLVAKMKGVKMQLETVATTDTLVACFKDMGKIIGKTVDNVNINNLQKNMEQFNMQMEKAGIMGEMMEDAMGFEEENIDDDEECNELIDRIAGGNGKGGEKNEVKDENKDTDKNFDNALKDL